jgi:hypothetical protein
MKKLAISIALVALVGPFQAWGDPPPLPQQDSPTVYPAPQRGADSQKIPAGIRLKVRFLSSLDAQKSNLGDPFLAETTDDLWVGRELILPKGTELRGRLEEVQQPSYFSKGGLMRLGFDHVVMPSGKLEPLHLMVDAGSAKMSAAHNGLYTDPGMGQKLSSSLDQGVAQYKSMEEKGVEQGEKMGGGLNLLLTVPTTAIAGVATGTAVTTVGAAKAVFGKGQTVVLHPGDEILLDFSRPATFQSQ